MKNVIHKVLDILNKDSKLESVYRESRTYSGAMREYCMDAIEKR